MEEEEARAVLGLAGRLSKMEIEAAHRRRLDEVRKRFDAAKENSVRMKCRRDRAAIEQALPTMLRALEEQERRDAEEREREERERLAAEKRRRDEQERLAAEKLQRDEQERLAAEKLQRDEQERLAAEKLQRDEQERLAVEKLQRDAGKWIKENIRPLSAGLGLVACTIASIFLWLHWQQAHSLGKLVLNTSPPYANVSIDGVSQGTTPLILDRIVPGEKHLRIELEGYEDEQLIMLIRPGDQRFLPPVKLIAKKEPSPKVIPVFVTPTITPIPISPTVSPHLVTPTVTPLVSATVSPIPVTPTATPVPTSPASGSYPGERYPQTREHVLTETEVASLDYAELRYAINEMYARHGAQFLKEPDVRKQFEVFSWYYPISGMTLAQIDAEFSRTESQNRDLLARLRDQKRPRK